MPQLPKLKIFKKTDAEYTSATNAEKKDSGTSILPTKRKVVKKESQDLFSRLINNSDKLQDIPDCTHHRVKKSDTSDFSQNILNNLKAFLCY